MPNVSNVLAAYHALVVKALASPIAWRVAAVPGAPDWAGGVMCDGKVEGITILLLGTDDPREGTREGTISCEGFVARLTPEDVDKFWALAPRSGQEGDA